MIYLWAFASIPVAAPPLLRNQRQKMALDCNLPKEKPPQPNWPEKLRI
jgi:hypothetical protein